MNPDEQEDKQVPANSWTSRVKSSAELEMVIKDCVLFIAFTHLFALLYFIFKSVINAVCGK